MKSAMHAAVDRTEIGRKANGTQRPERIKSNPDAATAGGSIGRFCSVLQVKWMES
jgi:hypothetical protein